MDKFMYKEFAEEECLKKEGRDFNLESTYDLCVKELTLQQSKRDQIIAFYIAIISFVVPTIVSMQADNLTKSVGFFALFVLGCLLTKVVIRYRIYKEVYWITCRTISQLLNFDQSKFSKGLIQHIFFKTMDKNKTTVLEFKDDEKTIVSAPKSFRKILNSAETVIFEVLVLMTSMVFWIGANVFIGLPVWGVAVASVLAAASCIYWNISYYRQLTKVYAAVLDGDDKSFNSAFTKAWFLHFF